MLNYLELVTKPMVSCHPEALADRVSPKALAVAQGSSDEGALRWVLHLYALFRITWQSFEISSSLYGLLLSNRLLYYNNVLSSYFFREYIFGYFNRDITYQCTDNHPCYYITRIMLA